MFIATTTDQNDGTVYDLVGTVKEIADGLKELADNGADVSTVVVVDEQGFKRA